jgi:hypothetical protein
MMRTWVGFLLPKGNKMFWNYLALALAFLAVYSYLTTAATAYRNKKMLEIQFILASVELLQLKYHTMQIAEIVYEKAIEQDETKRQEFELVCQKIEEKFDQRGNYYIKKLGKFLGEDFIHQGWKDAIKYAEELIKHDKARGKNFDGRKEDGESGATK